jgi:hypothetical protein
MSTIESHRTHRVAEELRRAVILTIRLTGAEHAQLHVAARARGISFSALGRSLLLGKIPASIIDRAFAQELGKVGNNLNQISRSLNAGVYPSEERLQGEVQALRSLLLQVQQELRRDRPTHQGD